VIAVDASALLEALLRTPAAKAVEDRLFAPRQTLHAPHLLDGKVAQVIRRYAANGEIDVERGRMALADLTDLPLESVRKVSFGIAQFSEHQPDRRQSDECQSGTV
jgi:predicted nucleic acid-binding protein